MSNTITIPADSGDPTKTYDPTGFYLDKQGNTWIDGKVVAGPALQQLVETNGKA